MQLRANNIFRSVYANSLLATYVIYFSAQLVCDILIAMERLNMRITFRGGFGANTNMSNHSLAMFPGTFSTGRRVARRTSQFVSFCDYNPDGQLNTLTAWFGLL